jgi:hypothetical protein
MNLPLTSNLSMSIVNNGNDTSGTLSTVVSFSGTNALASGSFTTQSHGSTQNFGLEELFIEFTYVDSASLFRMAANVHYDQSCSVGVKVCHY